jgi:hypothetical protein
MTSFRCTLIDRPLAQAARDRCAFRPSRSSTSRERLTRAHHISADAPTAELAERLTLVAAGFVPVTLIATTTFGVASLHTLALAVLVPAIVAVLVVLARRPAFVPLVVAAIGAGVMATTLYDLYRFSFLWLGVMHRDPIPHIGHALHVRPARAWGYLWRYLGNGSGLALAFCALGMRGVRSGIAFGLFVCAGLLVTLVAAPYGQQMLFPLNTATVVMAIGGHAIYGAVLGALAQRHPRTHAV